MGCGASKSTTATVIPLNNEEICMPKRDNDPIAVKQDTLVQQSSLGASFSKPLIPSITAEKTKAAQQDEATLESIKKPIAFEISLDDDGQQNHRVKVSLPKLNLTNKDIEAKLANTEERWKNLEEARTKRPPKPVLSSNLSEKKNKYVLKQHLLEKEIQATLNKQRELEKIKAKLARQEKHARIVQERKKKLEKTAIIGDELINVSWGGENGGLALYDSSSLKLVGQKTSDVDSGKGSSSASLNPASRSGSGKSNTGIDLNDGDVSQTQPHIALNC